MCTIFLLPLLADFMQFLFPLSHMGTYVSTSSWVDGYRSPTSTAQRIFSHRLTVAHDFSMLIDRLNVSVPLSLSVV